MQEYEIRVLKDDRTLSLTMITMQLSVSMAIREGWKIAQNHPFEVWRDDDRVYCALTAKPHKFSRMPRLSA